MLRKSGHPRLAASAALIGFVVLCVVPVVRADYTYMYGDFIGVGVYGGSVDWNGANGACLGKNYLGTGGQLIKFDSQAMTMICAI